MTLANKIEVGGLSGAPIKPYSLAALRTLRTHLPARIPLIGCGGISSGTDALEYAKAGASFIQVYTGFGYDGAGSCRRIKDQLVEALEKEGTTWTDVVKRAVTDLSLKETEVRDKTSDSPVSQLVTEAEELKRLVNQLAQRMGAHVVE